jgi:hypothetical protein
MFLIEKSKIEEQRREKLVKWGSKLRGHPFQFPPAENSSTGRI